MSVIQVAGMSFSLDSMSDLTNTEQRILRKLYDSPDTFSFTSLNQLRFELRLREQIMNSAVMMNDSNMRFARFEDTRANPQVWQVTPIGGIQLKPDISPSAGIQDFYNNSSMYAFECAGAIVIIYYYAILQLIGEELFDELYPDLYIYSWHADPDLPIYTTHTTYFIPGDVVYFENPEFHPDSSQWRGENAVVLFDDLYFGHGVGIKTAQDMISTLNRSRIPEAEISAYLKDLVARPSFRYLANVSDNVRISSSKKWPHVLITHNKTSIDYERYCWLIELYNPDE